MLATIERDTHPRRKVKVQLRQLGIELGSCGWESMSESVSDMRLILSVLILTVKISLQRDHYVYVGVHNITLLQCGHTVFP